MDQFRWQVARGAGVALRLQSLMRFAGLPLVETTIKTGALVRLQLLAAPAFVRPDATVVPLERKDAALLALLAFDGPTSRSRVAALLWPDADADKARNSLRQRLFRLRRAAGAELIEPDESLRLADGVEHNLGSPARRLAEDPTAAAGDLLGACVYEDCPDLEDWVRIAREHWRAMRRDALAELAAKREADGQIAQALVYAERLLAEDPVSEQAHRLAMRLHYRRGDRAAALAAYDRCRTALKRELGAEPDAETVALAQLILRADELPGLASKARRAAAILRPPRLIGRDTEWRALERGWEAGLPVLISGDAGLGKSRLLGDFAQARSVPMVGGRPGDTRVPYAVLARLLRVALRTEGRIDDGLDDFVKSELARVLPELGAAPVGPLVEARFRTAVVHALSARQAAGLAGLAIDDLHFADEATLELLPQVVIPELRWIGAVRGSECPAAIAAWLRAEGGQRLVEVPLVPLSESAVHELLTSLALPEINATALAGAIARHTGGNPFFVLETLNALVEAGGADATSNRLPTPTSVGALIERRLAQLSAPALKLARVAALAGADFSAALAAHVLQTHPLDLTEAWSELETAHVIRDDAFAHDLVFEATLRSVPEPIARVIHQDIAAYLTDRAAAPHISAHHWFVAGQKQMAAVQFAAAARQSFDASRYGEAGHLFERAADCYAAVGDVDEQHRSLQEVAGCRMKAFDLVGARRATELLRDIAQTDAQSGWALDRLIDTLNFSRADDALAETTARTMLELGRASAEPWMVFHATRKLAIALAQRGRLVEALQCFDTQNVWMRDHKDHWNVDVWFCDRAFVLELANKRDAATVAYRQVLTMARAHDNLHVAYAAQRNLSHLYWWGGDLSKAIAQSDASVRFSERLGDPLVDRNPRDVPRRAAILRDAGRFAEALELLLLARGELTRGDCPYWLAYCEDQLAQLFIDLGQPGRVQPLTESDVEALPPEVRVWRALLRARLARRVSHDALRWSRQAHEVAAEPTCPERWRPLAALDLACDVDSAEALVLCRRAAKEASQLECPGIRLHALARAACATAQARAAARLARDALALADNGIAPTGILMPEFFLCLYNALTVAGNADGALHVLRRGVTWINELALPNVPVEFRDSFINRNPVNRTILTTASRNR